MRSHIRDLIGDLALTALVFAAAGLLLAGANELPPPRFEPLGSAALPRILAGLMLVFGTIVAIRALLRLRAAQGAGREPAAPTGASPMRSVTAFAATVTLVAALDVFEAPFVPAATIFMGVVGWALSGWRIRAAAFYAAIGLGLALVLSWVFRTFLHITFG